MISSLREGEDDPLPDMGALVDAFDWEATPLGAREQWPPELRLAAGIVLSASVAMALYWGPDYRLLYNGAWARILRERHPAALGQPAAEVWTDIWDLVRPQFEEVRATGKGAAVYEQMLPMRRGGAVEETYWNYSITPVFDAEGKVAGLLNQGIEITRALFAERRLSFQVTLADTLRGLADPEAAKQAATELLGRYLGVARVGYAEVDEAAGLVRVRGDWTRDEETMSLAGQCAPIDTFGQQALAFLRTGEVLAVPDLKDLPLGSEDMGAAWEAVGVRSLITVPLVRDGALKALLYVHEPRARNWKRSDAAMARDVAERTWAAVERVQAEQSLRESEDHYRHTVELNPQVTWTALPDGQLNRVAGRWEEWTGTPGTGEGWAAGLHPDDVPRSFEAWHHSVATGEPYDIEHRVRHRDGSYRWARSRAFPRRDGEGAILFWYGSTEDIHERKIAEERQQLLINELNHRVKNTLATVQAIAFQTLKADLPVAEARGRFEARLMALSRAHNLLTGRSWEGAPLDRVVRDATEYLAEESGRFAIEGEEVWLAPRAALALALAFHELSTNAAKYGALSREAGSVTIRWRSEGGMLRIDWKETGGPAVSAPASRGFGSRLIERGLASDLGGSASMRFEPDGLACTIEAALDTIRTPEPSLG